ncbi:hypothetical protein SCHPADRAFT_106784 [Schizopora paradoxa]|uniref:SAP domain-containing protein n=1 Tax=Schizopora paradoxa TaxID=27342 RepID=A0A0H2S320_9AGAM|nr:hypothetical protein SCHPADRAFT_106784 [Schizopora paradoxa]
MSASAVFSGNLATKKKAELVEIAQALGVSDSGVREEIQQRVKKHLEDNASDLQDDPAFTGLYTRNMRQRSLQPQSSITSTTSQRPASTRGSLAAIRERDSTPVAEMRDVSMMLPKEPISPSSMSPSPTKSKVLSPSSLPPLPPSPAKSILEDAMAQPEVQAVVEMERSFMKSSLHMYAQTRAMLSNGRNIFVLTAILDVLSIIVTINKDAPYPIPPITVQAAPALHAMSMAISSWAGPTILLPAIIGFLVSFTSSESSSFDPLSASIIRVAANVAYDFPYLRLSGADGLSQGDGMRSLDVLGFQWRVVTSSLTLAFAFAEAIGSASRVQKSDSRLPIPSTPQ